LDIRDPLKNLLGRLDISHLKIMTDNCVYQSYRFVNIIVTDQKSCVHSWCA